MLPGDYHYLEPQIKAAKTEPVILKEKFEVALSPSNVGVFVGTGGKYIQELCSKYRVKVHLGEEGSSGKGRGQRLIGDTIKVTVSHKAEDKADVEGLKEAMIKRAKDVNISREKHMENVSHLCVVEH